MNPFLKVFLRSSAGEIELSTHANNAPFGLLDGARGLGLPTRSVESTPIPSGNGSMFRSQRFDESEVMLPIAIRDKDASLVATRARELEHVLQVASDDPIELIVQAPALSTVRRRFVYYAGGLEGAIGGSDSHFTWRHVQPKFLALDPMWYGEERQLVQKVGAARKPFITKGTGPLPTGRKNMVLNPSFETGLDGFQPGSTVRASIYTEDAAAGDKSVKVIDSARSNSFAGARAVIDEGSTHVFGSIAVKRLSGSQYFRCRLGWQDEIAGDSFTYGELIPGIRADEWTHLTVDAEIPATTRSVRLIAYAVDSPNGTSTSGTEYLLDAAYISDTGGTYFDGDTSPEADFSYEWLGEPGKSESQELQAQAEPQYRAPFFPVVLAPSTVEGAYQLDIQGDAEAWPIWEVDGPGEDLLIEDVRTGERIFIEGEFGETVTIDTRPTVADIYTDSSADGELWNRVNDDYTLFPLTPGMNSIKITMVNARPDSQVKLTYSETWLAGW